MKPMIQPKTRHKVRALTAAVSVLLAVISVPAMAGKLDLTAGAYTFGASNSNNNSTKSISGVGSYQIAFRNGFLNRFEYEIGYSLIATDVIGGDLSFGVDLGINYFPFTPSHDVVAKTAETTAVFQNIWRPFIGVSFDQRNFQSTSSQYAGGGAKIGTEYQLENRLSVKALLRYLSLAGPNKSLATQIDFMAGLTYQF